MPFNFLMRYKQQILLFRFPTADHSLKICLQINVILTVICSMPFSLAFAILALFIAISLLRAFIKCCQLLSQFVFYHNEIHIAETQFF